MKNVTRLECGLGESEVVLSSGILKVSVQQKLSRYRLQLWDYGCAKLLYTNVGGCRENT